MLGSALSFHRSGKSRRSLVSLDNFRGHGVTLISTGCDWQSDTSVVPARRWPVQFNQRLHDLSFRWKFTRNRYFLFIFPRPLVSPRVLSGHPAFPTDSSLSRRVCGFSFDPLPLRFLLGIFVESPHYFDTHSLNIAKLISRVQRRDFSWLSNANAIIGTIAEL